MEMPTSATISTKQKTYIITAATEKGDWTAPILIEYNNDDDNTALYTYFKSYALSILKTAAANFCDEFEKQTQRSLNMRSIDLFFVFLNNKPNSDIENDSISITIGKNRFVKINLYEISTIETIPALPKNKNETDEDIYRRILNDYQTEDAKRHINDLTDSEDDMSEALSSLTDTDIQEIVNRYDENHDCNIPDNDQWRNTIKNYINER